MQKIHFPNFNKPVTVYSLGAIISVGYRVKSQNGITKISNERITRKETKDILEVNCKLHKNHL